MVPDICYDIYIYIYWMNNAGIYNVCLMYILVYYINIDTLTHTQNNKTDQNRNNSII